MDHLINWWFGSTQGATAPVYRTPNEQDFLDKIAEIRSTNSVMFSRTVVWPGLIVWSYATTQDGANGLKGSAPIGVPVKMEAN